MQTIKQFLTFHLKEIEQKMIAESIEFVVGQQNENIFVKFIQFPDYFPMSKELLIELDNLRENSLFKIH